MPTKRAIWIIPHKNMQVFKYLIGKKISARWATLNRKVSLGWLENDHDIDTIIMGITRHANVYTSEAWYKCCVCLR